MGIKVTLVLEFKTDKYAAEARREIELPIPPFTGLLIRLKEMDGGCVEVVEIVCDEIAVEVWAEHDYDGESRVFLLQELKKNPLWSVKKL